MCRRRIDDDEEEGGEKANDGDTKAVKNASSSGDMIIGDHALKETERVEKKGRAFNSHIYVLKMSASSL